MALKVADERKILDKRANVFSGMTELMEKLAENGSLTAEERAEYHKRRDEVEELSGQLEDIRSYNRLDSASREVQDALDTHGEGGGEETKSPEQRYEEAYKRWFRYGDRGVSSAERDMMNATMTSDPEVRAVLDANALSTAPNSAGLVGGTYGYDAGYLIPQGFWANLQIALKAYGGLLQEARIVSTDSGNPMPWPTIDPTAVTGAYIQEANQIGFTDYSFGQGMLNAWTITSGIVLASIQLMADSAFDVNSFVSDRMGEAIGRKVAQELHTGTGSSALLGIETALAAYTTGGVAKGGLYSPGATAGASSVYLLGQASAVAKYRSGLVATIGFDDLQAMITYVDPAYRDGGKCRWITNDVTLAQLRNVTDNYGHPLWQPSVQVGVPDQILGYGVLIDQNTSAIPTCTSGVANAGGLLFGDFSRAMVVRQVNQAGTMRLTERYADYLQVGFLSYVRLDSRSNDLRAVCMYSSPTS
jgi:HK97 family phage major capsid protein